MAKIVNLDNTDRVTKSYLVDYLVANKILKREDAQKGVNGVIDAIVTALRAGAAVNMSNVGTIKPKHLAARTRRNPATGLQFDAPAVESVKFVPSVTLLDVLNGRVERETLSTKAPKSF